MPENDCEGQRNPKMLQDLYSSCMNRLATASEYRDWQSISVTSPAFQEDLELLLQATEAKTLQAYIVWRIIGTYAEFLSPEHRWPMDEFKTAALAQERWRYCVDIINSNLGHIAGHFFVQKMFRGESQSKAKAVVNFVRDTVRSSLLSKSLDWLDASAAAWASEKLTSIVPVIGFSGSEPNIRSSESLAQFYKDLQVESTGFIENLMRLRVWKRAASFKALGTLEVRNSSDMMPQQVQAYFDTVRNQVVISAALLQPPVFHADLPEYANFGGIGPMVGHEFTHVIDGLVRRYNPYEDEIYLTNTTKDEFKARSRCFQDQYSNFTVQSPGGMVYRVNSMRTLSENVADNGGLNQAFRAWRSRYESDPAGVRINNRKLPGQETFSPEQLFFVSSARAWCEKRPPMSLMEQTRNGVHSPAKWRINGAVQNSVEFATAFRCATDAPMNPSQKCQLW